MLAPFLCGTRGFKVLYPTCTTQRVLGVDKDAVTRAERAERADKAQNDAIQLGRAVFLLKTQLFCALWGAIKDWDGEVGLELAIIDGFPLPHHNLDAVSGSIHKESLCVITKSF